MPANRIGALAAKRDAERAAASVPKARHLKDITQ